MRVIRRLALVCIAAGIVVATAHAAAAPPSGPALHGIVVDQKGDPLEAVTVSVPQVRRGAITRKDGTFRIAVPGPGAYSLRVSQVGLTTVTMQATVPASGEPPLLRVVLKEAPIPVAEVSVRASSFGAEGKRQGATLRRMDIMTTPGAAADLMHSLHTLPGVHAPNEGAALYVRGGAPLETVVRLDGGDVGHPYKYETASGGLFGVIDPSLVSSAYFSSGAFAPKYGNALSGVLDIESTSDVRQTSFNLGANLVGGGGTVGVPLSGERAGLLLTAHYTDVTLLDRLYGASSDFTQYPRSYDGGAKILVHPTATQSISLFGAASHDRTGVHLRFPSYRGEFTNGATVQVWNAGYTNVVSKALAVRVNAADTHFDDTWAFSDFRYTTTSNQYTARADVVWQVRSGSEVNAGLDGERESETYAGTVPHDSTDYAPGAPTRAIAQDGVRERFGAYADEKLRVWRTVFANVGARVDRYGSVRLRATDGTRTTGSTEWTVDPRVALSWKPRRAWTLRASTGDFHQNAPLRYTDARFGNPALGPLAARHFVGAIEYATVDRTLRAEVYDKDYRHLVLNDPLTHYSTDGDGYARGIDLFAEGRWPRLRAWASYGYLASQRREFQATARVTSPYAPTHDLSAVATYHLNGGWDIGARARVASGAPYTPIVGAVKDSTRDVWHPVEGELFSARYPAYGRLDVRLMKYVEAPKFLGLPQSWLVIYVEGLNVLDIKNVLEYQYTPDYSAHQAVLSYFSRRAFVAGASIGW